MKLSNLNDTIKNFYGDTINEVDANGGKKPLTIRTVFLTGITGFEAAESAEEYVAAFDIGAKLGDLKADAVDVSENELQLLEKILVSKRLWTTIVLGRAFSELRNARLDNISN